MNVSALPAVQRRALAIAILSLLCASAWFIFVGPVLGALSQPTQTIKTSMRLLISYRAAAAARPGLEKTLRDLKLRAAAMPGLVQGESSALAAAQLQGDITALVENLGGTIRSSQNLPATAAGNYEELALIFSAAIPPDKLSELLYTLETHTPYLSLSEFHIAVPESIIANGTYPAEADVQWTVRASRWISRT